MWPGPVGPLSQKVEVNNSPLDGYKLMLLRIHWRPKKGGKKLQMAFCLLGWYDLQRSVVSSDTSVCFMSLHFKRSWVGASFLAVFGFRHSAMHCGKQYARKSGLMQSSFFPQCCNCHLVEFPFVPMRHIKYDILAKAVHTVQVQNLIYLNNAGHNKILLLLLFPVTAWGI